ncbi:putative enzyme related to lactoylglutathione lyase [Sphingobium sp. OAS761]|uniref:VOC family protein n=1 Tax=Sphingobium sp. OAS761 TaxID=2817901 RepID=UPI00209F6BD2|nr:VOC family protein [Sphingobium sp. OAS761]MCP1470379.1 putative enzyme related to lactoylglutathione lyase [Sphingobium sp. OAS761]
MQKAHFGFTKLIVQDLEAMATFYKDVAGLVEMGRVQSAVGDRAIDEILFNATGEGGPTLVLFKFLDREAPAVEESILGFITPDLAAFVDRTKAAGGAVVADIKTHVEHGVKVAFVTDPEGHLLEVVELLSA